MNGMEKTNKPTNKNARKVRRTLNQQDQLIKVFTVVHPCTVGVFQIQIHRCGSARFPKIVNATVRPVFSCILRCTSVRLLLLANIAVWFGAVINRTVRVGVVSR